MITQREIERERERERKRERERERRSRHPGSSRRSCPTFLRPLHFNQNLHSFIARRSRHSRRSRRRCPTYIAPSTFMFLNSTLKAPHTLFLRLHYIVSRRLHLVPQHVFVHNSEARPRHLQVCGTSGTPPEHLRGISVKLPRHLHGTTAAFPRHLRDSSTAPPGTSAAVEFPIVYSFPVPYYYGETEFNRSIYRKADVIGDMKSAFAA